MKKDFFEGKRPSVSSFRKIVSQLPKEEQIKCMQYFFDLSLRIWKTKKAAERRFLRCFVRSYRQEFLEYIHCKTILGELRYPPQDIEDLKKVINLVEQEGYRRRKTNYTSLAFSLLVAFDIRMRIKSLADGIRTSTPEADDLLDLIQRRDICFGRRRKHESEEE